MRNRSILSLLAASLLLAACATAPQDPPRTSAPSVSPQGASVTAGIERYMEQRAHVESVGFRLRRAASAECTNLNRLKPDLGLIVWSLANFPNDQDEAHLRSTYSLTNQVTVAISIVGAPAQKAGIADGAVITHVNGQELPTGKGATERFIALSNAAARNGPVILRLSTGESKTITAETVCEYPALLVRSDDLNAAADGRVTAITTALYDATRSDDELALILGHELAHNVLGHLSKSAPRSSATGGLLDAFLRSSISAALAAVTTDPFSPAREMDADYAGLYFMARAGYDVRASQTIWTRLLNSTRAPAIAKTHPPGTERLKALTSAAGEIRGKQRTGAPLEFTLKPHQ